MMLALAAWTRATIIASCCMLAQLIYIIFSSYCRDGTHSILLVPKTTVYCRVCPLSYLHDASYKPFRTLPWVALLYVLQDFMMPVHRICINFSCSTSRVQLGPKYYPSYALPMVSLLILARRKASPFVRCRELHFSIIESPLLCFCSYHSLVSVRVLATYIWPL